MNTIRKRAVFFDRDGTLNVEKNYLWRIEDFEFFPGVPNAIRQLNRAGVLVVVVTNQSGVARGYFQLDDVRFLHDHIQSELMASGARIDGFYICPHHPDFGHPPRRCDCRKPAPGMLLRAAKDLDIDLNASYMVGDKLDDLEAARRAGCVPLLVETGYGRETVHLAAARGVQTFASMPEAVARILAGI